MEGLAAIAAAEGALEYASRMWGASERQREERRAPIEPGHQSRYARQVAAARIALGDDRVFDCAWQEGRALNRGQAISLAFEFIT